MYARRIRSFEVEFWSEQEAWLKFKEAVFGIFLQDLFEANKEKIIDYSFDAEAFKSLVNEHSPLELVTINQGGVTFTSRNKSIVMFSDITITGSFSQPDSIASREIARILRVEKKEG